jgi:hypothetical protein
MHQALRPYATAGIALVGASMIAVTPLTAPSLGVQARSVRLVDAWSTLFADTAANWQNIINGADTSAISQVYSAFLTNPVGVIDAFSNLTPTVTSDLTTLPGTISVELPPGLALGIADLGATGATLTALNEVAGQLTTDPYESIATILNGFLNGESNVSLLGGLIDIPLYNGILAPEQPVDIDLNLTALVNALGLGNTDLSNLDLSNLLSQLGLGNLNLGSLFSDLGLSDKGLGTLLADATNPVTTLSGLLNLLGLNDLGTGDSITLGLTNILSGLGLDTNVDLSSLTLADVLGAFGINTPLSDLSGLSLSSILSSFGVDLPTGATLGSTTLTGLLTDLNLNTLGLGTLLQDAVNSGVLGTTVGPLISALLTTSESLLNEVNLGQLLDGVTLGQGLGGSVSLDTLLGDLGISLPSSTDLANLDIADVLTSLGVKLPGDLTIGGLLGDLGFSSSTGDLTLGSLLSDLGNPFGLLNITDLLNGLNVGDLLNDLGLSSLPVDLTNLGDLSGLTLGDLLGDLGLGNVATVSVEPIGGLVTELVDTVPQQILSALGM